MGFACDRNRCQSCEGNGCPRTGGLAVAVPRFPVTFATVATHPALLIVTPTAMALMTLAAAPATQPTAYPPARTVDQVDTYFGTRVHDPYRWMEDVDAPDVQRWIAQENALTNAYLDAVPGREAMRARLLVLTDYERFGLPEEAGGRYFYRHNTGPAEPGRPLLAAGLGRAAAGADRPQHAVG